MTEAISQMNPLGSTPPLTALVMISVPSGGAYITYSCTLAELLAAAAPGSVLDQLIPDWDSNTLVVAGTTILLLSSQWSAAKILSCSYGGFSGGTFTAEVLINGAAVGGLGGLSVGSGPVTTAASGANNIPTGATVALVISAVSGTPVGGAIQINMSRSQN